MIYLIVWIVLWAVEYEVLRADGEGDARLPLRVPPHPHQADRLLGAPGAARLLLYQHLAVKRLLLQKQGCGSALKKCGSCFFKL
jgi:hypothetical protein